MQLAINIALDVLAVNSELLIHSLKTANLCKKCLKLLPKDYISLSPELLYFAAILHDIGKTTWKNEWFNKPKNSITKNEWEIMHNHPIDGAHIAEELVPNIPKKILTLVANHHERPGGTGYPNGIKDLDNETLLLAACDVFCACTEKRLYRPAPLKTNTALESIKKFAPPEIVSAVKSVTSVSLEKQAVYG